MIYQDKCKNKVPFEDESKSTEVVHLTANSLIQGVVNIFGQLLKAPSPGICLNDRPSYLLRKLATEILYTISTIERQITKTAGFKPLLVYFTRHEIPGWNFQCKSAFQPLHRRDRNPQADRYNPWPWAPTVATPPAEKLSDDEISSLFLAFNGNEDESEGKNPELLKGSIDEGVLTSAILVKK